MIRCAEAEQAVRLGLRLVYDVGERHGFPAVRVGMHTGPAVERGGDWFGATVNLAARVSGLAGGGEVFVTEATRNAAGSPADIDFRLRGRRQLRNVVKPVTVFSPICDFGRSVDALPVDPVCRTAVDPDHAAGTLVHVGAEYHFCSLDCVRKFAEAPERYAGLTSAPEQR